MIIIFKLMNCILNHSEKYCNKIEIKDKTNPETVHFKIAFRKTTYF